eukprot:1793072-Prymnesium_polylepis.2
MNPWNVLDSKKKALVVGTKEYTRCSLRCSVNDARAMNEALREIGFDSELVTDCEIERFQDMVD